MNLDYHSRLQPESMKYVDWANRKLCLLAERISEKYPEHFAFECKNPTMYPHAGHLYSQSTASQMMSWTSTGLSIWPIAFYLPYEKKMTFNNYTLNDIDDSCTVMKSSDEIYLIFPEKYSKWRKLPDMSPTERILYIEEKLPAAVDKIIKEKNKIDKMIKEQEIRGAAAQYD